MRSYVRNRRMYRRIYSVLYDMLLYYDILWDKSLISRKLIVVRILIKGAVT